MLWQQRASIIALQAEVDDEAVAAGVEGSSSSSSSSSGYIPAGY